MSKILTDNIETVALSGAVEHIVLPMDYRWVWVRNDGGATFYISKTSNVGNGAYGTIPITPRDSARLYIDGTDFYITGSGSALVYATNTEHCPFKSAPASGGGVTGCNDNLLINPNFKINQRNQTEYKSDADTPYTVDRWKIVEGGCDIVNGVIALNGKLIQVLENAIGTDFTATVKAGVGEAAATYDNDTKTFTIIGNDAILEWAKLEIGSVATSFIPPNITIEQLKCQRYYLGLNKYIRYPMTRRATNDIDFIIPTNAMFRATPTLIGEPVVYDTNTTTAQSGFTFSIVSYGINAIAIRATKANHGLTSAYLEVTNDVSLDAEIY